MARSTTRAKGKASTAKGKISIQTSTRAASLAPAGNLKVTASAFAYCKHEEQCGYTRTLQTGPGPMKFAASTEADEGQKGRSMDLTFQIKSLDGKVLFETYGTFKIEYFPGQLGSLDYAEKPAEIKKLEDGRYKYFVSAMLDDGSLYDELETVVVARK